MSELRAKVAVNPQFDYHPTKIEAPKIINKSANKPTEPTLTINPPSLSTLDNCSLLSSIQHVSNTSASLTSRAAEASYTNLPRLVLTSTINSHRSLEPEPL